MTDDIAKTATLTGENFDGDTIELELPLDSQKFTGSNDINSFSRPQPDGENEPTRRALNMNRWEQNMQLTMKVTDRFAAENHNGDGDRPDLDNKEEFLDMLYSLAIAVELIDYKAVNDQTVERVAVWSGYIHGLDFTEKANTDNSVYDITVKLTDEVEMNS